MNITVARIKGLISQLCSIYNHDTQTFLGWMFSVFINIKLTKSYRYNRFKVIFNLFQTSKKIKQIINNLIWCLWYHKLDYKIYCIQHLWLFKVGACKQMKFKRLCYFLYKYVLYTDFHMCMILDWSSLKNHLKDKLKLF